MFSSISTFVLYLINITLGFFTLNVISYILSRSTCMLKRKVEHNIQEFAGFVLHILAIMGSLNSVVF